MPLPTPNVDTLVELLQLRANQQATNTAYTFLADGETKEISITYQELQAKAKIIAAKLQFMGVSGQQALLLYPPGLEYIAAFFGCLYAGVRAVPVYPPRRERHYARLEAIALDADALVALTTTEILSQWKKISAQTFSKLQKITWVDTTNLAEEMGSTWQTPNINSKTLAFLQYTSGSTGKPKGVMINHGNLLYTERVMHASSEQDKNALMVGWLPFYHDMGLIGNLLYPFYVGIPYIFMSPLLFIQKPIRWLKAISHYRGTVNSSPNFGYEICIDRITPIQISELDLSCWEVAVNGAEPIRPKTQTRFADKFAACGFRYEAFHSGYGLAESTLFVSGGTRLEAPKILTIQADALEKNLVIPAQSTADSDRVVSLVSCGQIWLNQKIVIVQPETKTTNSPNQVGEIWLSSPCVAEGYWNRPEDTQETFQAYLTDTGEGPFLRTGDLGFLYEGQLYVTGRMKDLIIIRGQNYYPQDIEQTVGQSHLALQGGEGGAFSIEVDEAEQLVVGHEIMPHALLQLRQNQSTATEIIQAIRWAVSKEYGVSLYAILLLPPRGLPRTSSGKVQRYACRAGYLKQSLNTVAKWQQPER